MRAALVFLIVFLAGPAAAQQAVPARLTDRGRTMLAGSVGGWLTPDDEVTTRWSVDLRPSVTYLVIDRLGVGGYLGVNIAGVEGAGARYDGSSESRFTKHAGGGIQALYEIELGERLGLVLSAWLGYQWSSQPYAEHQLPFGLSVPLLVHLSDAVGVGFGPYVAATFKQVIAGDNPLSTQLGVTSTLFFSF